MVPDVVRFSVLPQDPRQLVPEINGVTLVDLITAFELSHDCQPAGGYGGLVPDHFNFGDLSAYLLGQDNDQWPRRGRLWLLGCDCGEVGCWPLEAKVELTADLVLWDEFSQPHRRGRDYAEFGPWVFEREQYERAVSAAVVALDSTS